MPFSRLTKGLSAGLMAVGLALFVGGCHPVPTRPADSRLPVSPILFQDVAAQAGLNYQWQAAGHRPFNILQTIGNGCAFLDYDNSGVLSILLVGTDRLALFKGDGHGHFRDISRQMGLDRLRGHFLGCAVGDFDNDGYDDIYVSGYRTGLLLHNEGGKGFKDVTTQAGLRPQLWGTSCAFAETVPGSGRLDLFVANYADFGQDPKKYQQLCPSRGIETSCGPRYYKPLKDVFYRNDGHGHFTDVSRESGVTAAVTGKALGVACAPLDGSMRPYIAVADDEMLGDLLQPKGPGGRYTNIGGPAGVAFDRDGNIHGGMGTDWGDYDNDGRLDLIVGTFQSETKSLYHNDGGALFSDQSYQTNLATATIPWLTFGTKWADFDNDGWLDLMLANGHVQDNIHDIDSSTTYRQPTLLFHNDGGHRFTDLSQTAGPVLQRPIVGRGLAVGDFDNDGRVDALVVDSEGKPLLLHNESRNAGHFLSLTLVGTKSNRDGYGALVTVQTPGLTQTRLCHADGSYLSSSDKRIHVGLGTATSAQRVSVRWPSGHTDTFHAVAADHFYTLREGDRKLKG